MKILQPPILLALLIPFSLSALEIDFDTPKSAGEHFNFRTSGEKGMYQTESDGIDGSGSVNLPFAKQTQVYATTRQPVADWTGTESVTVSIAFRTHMPFNSRTNRRALNLGISGEDAVEPKPSTLGNPVHPFTTTVFAGIYTRAFNEETDQIEVSFHGTQSEPDKNFSLTSDSVVIQADQWYELEARFMPSGEDIAVGIALREWSADGSGNILFERIIGEVPSPFADGTPLHAFFSSRDPDFSGVKHVDAFKAF